MPLTVELDVSELAATRFAISPLSETVAGLQQLAGHVRRAVHLPWVRWAEAELAREALDLPGLWPLIAGDRASWPSFLIPAPRGAGPSLEDDLAVVRRTTAGQVRASLGRVFGADLPDGVAALAARPSAGLEAITEELRAAYARLIEPHWPRIRAVLEADVAYRARQLATGGAARLFGGLHPDLSWRAGRLVLAGADRAVELGPGGLVLMPVALAPAHVMIKRHTTTQTTIRYPARGVGALWSAAMAPVPPVRAPARRSAQRGAGPLAAPGRGAAGRSALGPANHAAPEATGSAERAAPQPAGGTAPPATTVRGSADQPAPQPARHTAPPPATVPNAPDQPTPQPAKRAAPPAATIQAPADQPHTAPQAVTGRSTADQPTSQPASQAAPQAGNDRGSADLSARQPGRQAASRVAGIRNSAHRSEPPAGRGAASGVAGVRGSAREADILWAARPPSASAVRLLGRARAELLTALHSPATTTDLARALAVTPSAVSQHLRILRENGLVTRERSGRSVLYVITPLGEALIRVAGGRENQR
ncbi:ArsR family transcriptional regulator [Amycolatopsis sp. NPDC006125]|uniref:ArsR family transcriptional regulator n=1 Tax=Amycolatopsis sp. NPDC006125 TaxID=3156730 RepID=UPI0033A4B585